MKNRINKTLNLILLLSMLNGNVLPMRENDIEPNTQAMAIDQDVQQELSLLGLPAEVIEYILYQIIEPYEDRMKNVNNIFGFYSQQLDLKPLVSDLSGVSLTSKGLRLWTLDLIDRLKKLKARKYQELINQIKDQYQGVSEDGLNSRLRNILNRYVNRNNLEEAAKLILAGANVNEKDNDGFTALIWAARTGHKDIVELLIDNDTNVNEKNNNGNTTLMLAVTNGYKDIVELLIGNSANINEKNNNGSTALMFAARDGRKGIVQLLINSSGTNVNEKNNDGATALMWVAIYGHKEVAQLLINSGANINEKNNDGATALILAEDHGHKGLVQLLEAAKIKNGSLR